MESLLKLKIILLTFIISTTATSKDTRPCDEKILGPLDDDNLAPTFQPFMVDESNTLTLRCRVICQEAGASYNPHVRIITTKDGEIYRYGGTNLYEVQRSPSDIICNSASPTRVYEFRITVHNDTLFNESIASCGVFYISEIERNFTHFCDTSTLAWITLPSRPTTMPPTTAIPTTIASGPTTITTQETTTTMTPPTTTTTGPNTMTLTDSSTSEDTFTGEPEIDAQASTIPDGVSIFFIIVAAVCIALVLSIGALFLYKKVAKTPKRKISSVHPSLEDGSTLIQAHEGVLKCEDIESDSTVKFRTSAQN